MLCVRPACPGSSARSVYTRPEEEASSSSSSLLCRFKREGERINHPFDDDPADGRCSSRCGSENAPGKLFLCPPANCWRALLGPTAAAHKGAVPCSCARGSAPRNGWPESRNSCPLAQRRHAVAARKKSPSRRICPLPEPPPAAQHWLRLALCERQPRLLSGPSLITDLVEEPIATLCHC